jgi:hypothetical protein
VDNSADFSLIGCGFTVGSVAENLWGDRAFVVDAGALQASPALHLYTWVNANAFRDAARDG